MKKSVKMEYLSFTTLLMLTIGVLQTMAAEGGEYPPPCDSQIYCHGRLLHTVQMARIFKDSKTFVDMKLKYAPTQILTNFELFMSNHKQQPSKEDVATFVASNFDAEGSEFEPWNPSDWHENPAFLKNISDLTYRAWARNLHEFWKELGRKIKDDVKLRPELYSMIYSDNPVIVPGGRFREIFYWDSFWIMRGLLLSEMSNTVKGMLLNFMQMVTDIGYIPNGGRVYFKRSQPPLLIPMFKLYMDSVNDTKFLRESIPVLEKEFQFWIKNRTTNINVNGKSYEVVRYNVEMDGPRPESYREDYELAESLSSEEEKRELYFNLKSAAESGWDFSSRWFLPPQGVEASLIHTKTRHVVPVELNSFIYYDAVIMADFYSQLGNKEKAVYYRKIAQKYKTLIEEVFWDEEDGSWYDYDMLNNTLRKIFYTSNLVPLWVGAFDPSGNTVTRVTSYLKNSGVLKERGGVPTSLVPSGEQWDYPNGWAPLQYFMVDALAKVEDKTANEIAYQLAEKWVKINYKAFEQSRPNHMFEKYDVTVEGLPGGGGEYDVVVGFGWTNGVVMDFLNRYGDRLQAPTQPATTANAPQNVIAPATLAIGAITLAISLLGLIQVYRILRSSGESTGKMPNSPTKSSSYQSVSTEDNEESLALMEDDDTISSSLGSKYQQEASGNSGSDCDKSVYRSTLSHPNYNNNNSNNNNSINKLKTTIS